MPSIVSGKRVLITGAGGYLAAGLVRLLKDEDCHLIRLSRRKLAEPLHGAATVEDVIGDVREEHIWKRVLEAIDVVFHFAAQTSVNVADADPLADFEINVRPMLRLLETCRQIGRQPTVLFAGTSTQVGIPGRLPVDESFPDHPLNIYDLHKLMAEQYLKYYVRQGVVQGASLRLTNVYGPGPESSSPDRGVLNLMAHRALSGESLTIYGTGDVLRDYLFVDDAVSAFLAAAQHIDALNGEHFIVGTGEGHTVADGIRRVAEAVQRQTGKQVSVEHVDPPAEQSEIDLRNFVADPRRFMQATGWQPRWSLTDGIEQTVAEFS